MDIFFSHKYKYIVNDSIENLRKEIESISKTGWFDLSNDITSRLNDDGGFTISHRLSFVGQSPAYLTGTLSADGRKTIIDTTLRPNLAFVILFYFLSILFIGELLGIVTFFQETMTYKILIFPFLSLIVFGLMQMSTGWLRTRWKDF